MHLRRSGAKWCHLGAWLAKSYLKRTSRTTIFINILTASRGALPAGLRVGSNVRAAGENRWKATLPLKHGAGGATRHRANPRTQAS